MEKSKLLTITGEYWHFHLIGTGTIFTYHKKAKQVLVVCVATGSIINIIDKYIEGGYNTIEEFRKEVADIYLKMIYNSDSLDLSFYDNPTYIAKNMVEVDFGLLNN